MQIPITQGDLNYLVYAGALGILIGFLFFIFFSYRRIRLLFRIHSIKKPVSPRILAGFRNLFLIFIWLSVFGMVLFFGFFLLSYHAFTYEKPVAEIITRPSDRSNISQVTLVQFFPVDSKTSRYFLIKGDQWMIEGDILKWDNWLNFLGLQTRYRLTRIRGHYLSTEAEINQPHTIYSLIEHENHPLWRHLYEYGHRLPFVSSVYGNAAFQGLGKNKRYLIYVGRSGFVVREGEKKK